MSMALELLIYIGLFILALGLLVSILGDSDEAKRKLRSAHERRGARPPATSSPRPGP